jgi:hypothetical protein
LVSVKKPLLHGRKAIGISAEAFQGCEIPFEGIPSPICNLTQKAPGNKRLGGLVRIFGAFSYPAASRPARPVEAARAWRVPAILHESACLIAEIT